MNKIMKIIGALIVVAVLLTPVVLARSFADGLAGDEYQFYIFGDNSNAIPQLVFNWSTNQTYLFVNETDIFYEIANGTQYSLINSSGSESNDGFHDVTKIVDSKGDEYSPIGPNIQLAVDNVGDGGWVQLPSGNLKINDTIYLNYTISLLGMGHGATIISTDTGWAGGDMIAVDASSNTQIDFLIRDMSIHGDSDITTNDTGIHFGRGADLHIYNIYQKYCNYGLKWDDNFHTAGSDWTIDLYCNNVILENNNVTGFFYNNTDGNVYRGSFEGGYIYGNSKYGIHLIEPDARFGITNIEISANDEHGIYQDNGTLQLTSCQINSNSNGNNNLYDGIHIVGTNYPKCLLNNIFIGGSYHRYLINLSSSATARLIWVTGRLVSANNKIDWSTNAQMEKCQITGVSGYVNSIGSFVNKKHGDTLSYTMDEDAAYVTFASYSKPFIVYASTAITGGSFTLGMRWLDNTTVSTNRGFYYSVHGRTAIKTE